MAVLNTMLLENAAKVCPARETAGSSTSATCRSCALKRRLFLKDPFPSRPSKVMLQHET